jgi:hypothetical protein
MYRERMKLKTTSAGSHGDLHVHEDKESWLLLLVPHLPDDFAGFFNQ